MTKGIFLPDLISIEIKDYTLYEQKPNFKYEFIKGVNLIIGGNGVGKTTFVNLIRYGLIGAYVEGITTRVYNLKEIRKRKQLSKYYFKNRMSEINKDAQIILNFKIKNVFFEVVRSLYQHEILSVKVIENNTNYYLKGKIITQGQYEKKSDYEKRGYLQYNYEEIIKYIIDLNSFEDFIFLINEVMMFGESRNTILWDIDKQNRLANKYFNSKDLDKLYEESRLMIKHYDSLARHKQEEIKAIKRVLTEIDKQNKNNENIDLQKTKNNIEKLRRSLNRYNNNLINCDKDIRKIENILKTNYTNRTKLTKKIIDYEKKVLKLESDILESVWQNLHPQYEDFQENIKINKICPMCNKEIKTEVVDRMINNPGNCFLCNQKIASGNLYEDEDLEIYKQKLNTLLNQRKKAEHNIAFYQQELNKLVIDKDTYERKVLNCEADLRKLESSINSRDPRDEKDSLSYEMMMKQIIKLDKEKGDFKNKRIDLIKKSKQIAETIAHERIKVNNNLSDIFSKFACNFIGLPSYLAYTDSEGDGKRNVAVINNIPRYDEDELSESQRFFIDQSYRMSILNYFYSNPSFFICETPDSSLDISYEENAASIFLEYLRKPNSLIITSNLNNSRFLEYIIENATNIKHINLLKYGKISSIQSGSDVLKTISERISKKIHEKYNNK